MLEWELEWILTFVLVADWLENMCWEKPFIMEYSDSVDELNVNLFPIQYYAIIEGFLIRATLVEF